jgi:hypothetical protein
MAKRFLTPINVLNAESDPESASEGDIYYNTSVEKLKIYSNFAWVEISSGESSGISNLDGGSPGSIYLETQSVDGGMP